MEIFGYPAKTIEMSEEDKRKLTTIKIGNFSDYLIPFCVIQKDKAKGESKEDKTPNKE